MNSKGFTLVELIAVIALLAIVSVISIVSINVIIDKNEIKDCENLISNITIAAKEYASDNRYGEIDIFITAEDLIKWEYLVGPMVDPFTGEEIDGELITIDIVLKEDKSVDTVIIKDKNGNIIDCGKKILLDGSTVPDEPEEEPDDGNDDGGGKTSVDVPLSVDYCINNLVYNGEEQQLLSSNTTLGYTLENRSEKNVGNYEINAILNEGYIWSDGTSENKKIECRIIPKSIKVVAGSASKSYDGNPLTSNECIATGLVAGDVVSCEMTASSIITAVGTSPNVIDSIKIKDSDNIFVTDNYSISKENGILEVTKANSTLSVEKTSLNLTYAGTVSGTLTYSYNGDGVLSCTSSNSNIECSLDNGIATITAKGIGNAAVTISATDGHNYMDPESKNIDVSSIAQTYTVNYYCNGGTGCPNSQIKTYGETLTLSSIVPSKDGYEFVGWGINSTATSATYASGESYTENQNKDLYAIYVSIYSDTWQSLPEAELIYYARNNYPNSTYERRIKIKYQEEYNEYQNKSRIKITAFQIWQKENTNGFTYYLGDDVLHPNSEKGVFVNGDLFMPMSYKSGGHKVYLGQDSTYKNLTIDGYQALPWTTEEFLHAEDGTGSVTIGVNLDIVRETSPSTYYSVFNQTKTITLKDLRT